MNVWNIHLKINCLQLMWWQFNHFKMRNSASWAHHSRPVDFGEHNSRPQRAMCTSSILHASSKALPFFMSGHVCHLIVFSPHMHPPFSSFMLINCVFFGATCAFATVEFSWLNDWAERRKEGSIIVYSWETLGKSELLIALILLFISKSRLCYSFPIIFLFCFGEKENISAE